MEETGRRGITKRQALVGLALALILIAGAYFRFTGLNWDQDQHLHPDERFLTMVETSIAWPRSVGEYFDSARSPLNPYNRGYGFFVYGTLPIFLVKLVGILLSKGGYGQIHLVGRAFSGLFDLGTVVLIFLIARKLYDTRVGLLAAALTSLAVLPIQHSHFFTVETFVTLFTVVTFYFALQVAEGGRWWHYGLLGVSLGMAVACKISAATLILVMGLAGGMRIYAALKARGWLFLAERTGAGLIFSLALAFIVFRILQPYAFTGPGFFNFGFSSHWLEEMRYVRRLMNGEIDYPPGHQWTDRTPLLFPWQNMVWWGMGLPLGLTAWAGWGLALFELFRGRWRAHLLPLAWVSFIFLYQGAQFVKSMRYLLPLYPFLIMLGAYLLVWLWDRGRARGARYLPHVAAALIAFVLASTFLWAFAFTRIYARPHSRVQASRWIYANIPPGTRVANEHWDDPIPLRIDGKDGFGGMYQGLDLTLYDEDTPEKLDKLLDALAETDYIFITSGRLYTSIPRLPMRYPMTTRYYQLLLAEELGFKRVATFTSYPSLGPIQFNDDWAEEQFTVYDHPKVLIFQKTADFSRERARALLGDVDWESIRRLTPRQASEELWRARLARIPLLGRVLGRAPSQPPQLQAEPVSDLMLDQPVWEAQQGGGTWSAIFNRRSLANRFPALAWLFVVELLGLLAFPIAFVLFRNLADRGYVLAKSLAILLMAYLAWIAASLHLLPYTRATILLALAMVTPLAAFLAWVKRGQFVAFLGQKWRLILINEALFLGFFFLFWAIRLGNPDLWHPVTGGEKPMDFAYLNAVIKSSYFPPYDPWFAGGYLNYYYFGFVIVGTLIKLTGVVPWVAYNLTIPLLFALTAMGAFCVVYNLGEWRMANSEWRITFHVSRFTFGLLGGLFVAVIGNLGQMVLIVRGLWDVSGLRVPSTIPGLEGTIGALAGLFALLAGGKTMPVAIQEWYWNATRVIPDTINEFPFFTFLYADLHAHMIALPLTLLVLAMAVNAVKEKRELKVSSIPRRFGDFFGLLVIALTLGALRPTNTWDYPTYLLIALVALAMQQYQRRGRVDLAGLKSLLWRFAALLLLSTLLFQPFHSNYAAAYFGVELWKGERTGLGHYLIIHGLFLFAIGTFLLGEALGRGARNGLTRLIRLAIWRWERLPRFWALYRTLVKEPSVGHQLSLIGLGLLALLVSFSALKGLWLFAFLLPLLMLAVLLFFTPQMSAERRFVVFLVGVGLALSLGVEVLVIKGDIGRMNTVFKFYLQIWVLFALAAAYGLSHLLHRLTFPRRRLWWAAFALLFLCCSLYPILATNAKVHDRFDPSVGPTLDGMAYMRQAVYHDQGQPMQLKWDYEAIHWVLDNVSGSPVILEGHAVEYRWGSRVSIYTGLPAVIGWNWHQRQQRAALQAPVVERRIADVRTIYDTLDMNEALALLQKYDVSYIYVGQMEWLYYSPEGLAKFERMREGGHLDLVYENEGVKIYKCTA